MSRVRLEVCCGSADDVIQAHLAGADRVELNSDLFHGGLTPTLGELIVAKRETGMPVMTMVRPREGGFCYTQAEFDTAIEDAKLLLHHGADGLVFGFLHPDGTIDLERTRVLAELAREGFDPKYGARPLRRAIQSRVEDAVAEKLLDGTLKAGDTAKLTVEDEKLLVTK